MKLASLLNTMYFNFNVKIVHHLEERLFELQDDSLLPKFAIFDPTTRPESRKNLAVYGMPVPLLQTGM